MKPLESGTETFHGLNFVKLPTQPKLQLLETMYEPFGGIEASLEAPVRFFLV